MNLKKVLPILVLLTLAAYAFFLISKDSPSSGLQDHSDFAIKNIGAVDKITIKDLDGSVVTLTKKDKDWIVNNDFKARPENINLILETLGKMEVQTSIRKKNVKTILNNLAGRHKKVSVYAGRSKAIKTEDLGNATQDHLGTFMLLESNGKRSSTPYVVHLPGFDGFLESRFFSNALDWKYTGVFDYDPKAIEKIHVAIGQNVNEGFQLIQNEPGNIGLLSYTGEPIATFDTSLLKSYLLGFKQMHYNSMMHYLPHQIDSIKSLTPHYTLSVTAKGVNKNVKFYKMAALKGQIDPVTKMERKFDVNYILGIVNDSREIARYQYHVTDPFFKPKSYFLP